ncbi:hypothetical protein LSUE1_G000761 [Lachnellula suecica]|uniref:Uncharacterized protein n=1 Tax=Lachnellula suecica TaxID=602035 RepID=A0A8T9CN13_9HELO|nr:hypothetical protein LSUE1_G000761 [Lachnellula suecica]
MPGTSPVILIIGAGANIGAGVARSFATKGYKVALVARKLKESESTADQLNISTDLSDPSNVAGIFAKVKASLGLPSVVVYNASSVTPNPPNDPLAVSVADLTRDLNVTATSAYVAAQQALAAFKELPATASKTFIYTGNIMDEPMIIGPLLDLGVGKSAAATFVQFAANAYKDQGIKFYYGDERKADGSAIFKVNGEAHGKFYLELAEGKSQGPWKQTFVNGASGAKYEKFAASS